MSYTALLSLIALGILLASPAFSQSPENPPGRAASVRPVTITTAGGRTYIVGVQRNILESVETPVPAPRKPINAKESAGTKLAP